ncbi:MAG TPA: hypothetical protein VJQ46_12500 [Gemmatimonadales bacterium]|nr:hypothetical protein [Gemmatimonadales bacterium]
MTNRWWCAAALVLAACNSAGPANQVHPANTAAAAVQNFMKAVADSNLTTMAGLWGTTRGPASKTRQPPDYERRIAVMQAYLSHDDFRILSDNPDGSEARRAMQVQIRRQACTWDIPFTVILLADRTWIINQVDLASAGNPAKPCDPSAKDTASAPGSP